MTLTDEDKEYLCERIDQEGSVEYTFLYYSKFGDLPDPEFHKRIDAYKAAHQALVEYIGYEPY